jgi:glutaredoxin
MEEVVHQDNQFTSCGSAIAANIIEQARIEMYTDFYFRRGGSITVVDTPNYKVKPVYELDESLRDQFERGRANANVKSVKDPSRKYIRTYARKSPQVIVNGVYVGSYPDMQAAVIGRDQYLIDNNMPPAGD